VTPDAAQFGADRRRRSAIPFRVINRRGAADHDSGLQRHHLLPRQLLARRCFGPMFEQLGAARVGFDDFRRNGLLLPASEAAVKRLALPLHRGPHHAYNRVVIERVGQIEQAWMSARRAAPDSASVEALMRLDLLQAALRRKLLDPERGRYALHRRDPLGWGVDFTELDAMADQLWPATEPRQIAG
jgi:hypothetical protein